VPRAQSYASVSGERAAGWSNEPGQGEERQKSSRARGRRRCGRYGDARLETTQRRR
jgi:hypothetical protein